jgi:Zn-dependent protease
MLLGEPAPTPADFHFRLFGFPVRVHPLFWIITLILGMGSGKADPVNTLVWVPVVLVSILVHELGHAFVQRYYGGHPWITLYSFGGLASCNDCDNRPLSQILISLAGPVAGFLFAGVVIGVLAAMGRIAGLTVDLIPVVWIPFDLQYYELHGKLTPRDALVWDLLQVNILWGLVNLLPIYPLDGGHIARELLTLGNSRNGIVRSLQLSIGTAALVAAYALLNGRLFLCVMFAVLAAENFQTLQRYRYSWR